MSYTGIDAVLFDFVGVVADVRMTFTGEPGGPYRVEPIEEVLDAVARLKQSGISTALVSNNDRESLFTIASNIDFGALFDATAFSSDVGSGKPNRPIFDYVLRRLDLNAEQCLFVDDLASNVDAAVSLGMRGLVADRPSTVVAAVDALLEER